MKDRIIKIYEAYLKRASYKFYSAQFKRYCAMHGIPDSSVEGEMEYIKKWSVLTPRVEPYSYRLFSRYMGADADIIPEDIGHTYLENILNPRRYRDYYADKNIFDNMFCTGTMPVTILRRMRGSCLLNACYEIVNNLEWGGGKNSLSSLNRLVLKPTVDSCSGQGVMLFEKVEDDYIAKKENVKLTGQFLFSYSDDFILQEAIEQHPLLARFNSTSVNTLRVAVYRSVKDEQVHVVSAILRVGRSGEVCDNAHMGGKFIGIDPKTGLLGKYTCDQYGNISDDWNGINYRTAHFAIPHWEKVVAFAEYVGSKIHHCRLVALDITLDKEGNPKLIEFNVEGFSFWLFMYCGQKSLGPYTDEIIAYCLKERGKRLHLRII